MESLRASKIEFVIYNYKDKASAGSVVQYKHLYRFSLLSGGYKFGRDKVEKLTS